MQGILWQSMLGGGYRRRMGMRGWRGGEGGEWESGKSELEI